METQWLKIDNQEQYYMRNVGEWCSVQNFYRGVSPAFVKGRLNTAFVKGMKIEAYLI
jgi:hypothetical protein